MQWTRRLRFCFKSCIVGGAPLMRSVRPYQRMHFVDLTPYTRGSRKGDPPALNVGWLDSAVPFDRGPVPPGFVERLKALVLKQHHSQTRGYHVCQFCPELNAALHGENGFDRELYQACHTDGRLSSAEIRVQGEDGRCYAAPRMIAHYVEAHSYRPPEDFIEAVMKT